MITQEKLKELLHYDSETGIFTWKIAPRNSVHSGDVAGSIEVCGYRVIGIGCKLYKAHRLAWLYVYGVWPKAQLDHLNGIRTDNRIANLRDVSRRENQNNQKRHRNGKLPGAKFDKRDGRWYARIKINGRQFGLGGFSTELEAHKRYLEEKKRLQEG